MVHRCIALSLLAGALTLTGCATHAPIDPADLVIERGTLPEPDVALNIAGLGPCTDSPERTLHLNSHAPVNVLVHGCFGSAGQFRALAQVLAFQGQQAACFSYDDRADLTTSATELRQALNTLSHDTDIPAITLIGHSQGALIARKSLTALPEQATPPAALSLVTISGPFGGIRAAAPCGYTWMHVLSLGLSAASCHLITGAKWADITDASHFIREPGALIPQVQRYVKIDTDERDTCRRQEAGRCVEDDVIFSLAEQHQPGIDNDQRTEHVRVAAGHVEIVGDQRQVPTKLLDILQERGILWRTAPERAQAYRALLARVYHAPRSR